MFQSHDHHIKDNVCLTRPPYRNGKKLRAVKVYTIAQESKYLLIQNIPAISGVLEQLLPYFNQYGNIEQYWRLDGYERKDPKDDEQFIDTILIKFVQIHQARLAKCRLDDMNFMGSNLHICYAPECENLEDLREKMMERRTIVERKKNLMKIFILLLLLISPIELRLHNDDIYELDNLLNKYDKYKYRPDKSYISNDDDDDDEQDFPSSYQHKKAHPSRKKIDNTNKESETDDSEDPLLLKKTTTTQHDDLSDTVSCFNGYNLQIEQLVKVKELKNGAHMIRHTLIDKRTLGADVDIRDECMLNCCAEKTCDLAMISEQPTHEGYKCYLFACNGTCPLAPHQDYSVMVPGKFSAYFTTPDTTKNDGKSSSTISNVIVLKRKSFFRETSVIIFLIFGLISTIILFIFIFRQCVTSQKRGRKSKNYSVDADYLINGLYL